MASRPSPVMVVPALSLRPHGSIWDLRRWKPGPNQGPCSWWPQIEPCGRKKHPPAEEAEAGDAVASGCELREGRLPASQLQLLTWVFAAMLR